jgi:glutamate synthase (NADPH/NADH) large chain
MERVGSPANERHLFELIEQHAALTGSTWARGLVDKWNESLIYFWQVLPK